MWWRRRELEEGPSFPVTAPVPARSAGALPDPGAQPGARGGSLTLLLPLCLQKIGFLLLLMEVCTYRTCRRKMPCPPTGVSPSTSTAGRRGRATAPGSPSQVSPWGCQRGRGARPVPGRGRSCAREGPSPARCPLPCSLPRPPTALPSRTRSNGIATSGPRSEGTSRSGAGGPVGASQGAGSARAVPPSTQLPPSRARRWQCRASPRAGGDGASGDAM